ncbi:hypothetical protein [Streptomyces sp. NPDC127036]|uniref:hypothetical protein n=1 Tax=Streptomyces sp. NPDC127036 TaxID=3347112 RepID=UPI00365CC4ED
MTAINSLPTARTRRRGPHLSGLVWLTWRQHRSAFWTGLFLLAVLTAFVVVQRSQMVSYIETHHLSGCIYEAPESRCEGVNAFRARFYNVMHYTGLLISFIPLIIGVFLGGPLLARELENETYALSCSQSVSRTRWISFKLGLPATVTTVGTGALSLLYTWWWRPADTLLTGMYWYQSPPFNNIGLVPIAMSLLALLCGAAIGMVLRRTVAAMVVTGTISVIGWFGLNLLRPHLWPLHETTAHRVTAEFYGSPAPLGLFKPNMWPLNLPNQSLNVWTVDSGYLTSTGQHFGSSACGDFSDASASCLKSHDVVGVWAQYHPASDFWPLQLATSSLILALAAAVTVFSIWWARNRA